VSKVEAHTFLVVGDDKTALWDFSTEPKETRGGALLYPGSSLYLNLTASLDRLINSKWDGYVRIIIEYWVEGKIFSEEFLISISH